MEEKKYTYQDRTGHSYEVTQKHIDEAVAIYEELSKASRSKRVSWAHHKRMMEKAGYYDSGTSESYRQLIKRNRKKQGTLPERSEYVEHLGQSMLDSIKSELGEINHKQLEANDSFTRLRKLQRDMSRDLVMIEALKEKMDEVDWSAIGSDYEDYFVDEELESPVLVALTSDWHYGYDVPRYYTPEKTRELVKEFTTKIIRLGYENNVKKIVLVDIGDKIEGVLRNQSIVDSKITPVEQMIEATWIMIDMIDELLKHFDVSYFELFDNHSRITPNKNDALEDDSYVTISKSIIERYAQSNERLTYIEPVNNYYHIMDINGVKMYFCHGHREAVKNNNTLAQLSMNHGVDLDLLIHGHYHTFGITEVSDDKYQFSVGSIKGPDAFSDKISKKSSRSQGAILVYEDGSFDMRQIKLDN